MSMAPPPPPGAPPPPIPPSAVKKPIWKRWWFIGAALFIVIGIIGSLAAPKDEEPPKAQDTPTETASSLPTPTLTPTVAPAAPTSPAPPQPPPAPSFVTFEGDGTYAVPGEVKPATYRTREGSPGCYWARLKNFEGELESINANDNTDFPAVVTITKQDKGFEARAALNGRLTYLPSPAAARNSMTVISSTRQT